MAAASYQETWDAIYGTKPPNQRSWTQQIPGTSLDFIHSLGLAKSARIIDVGGGDSKLVDHLLAEGYQQITVLDVSAKALESAKNRLGAEAKKVEWIYSDIIDFSPVSTYDLWHDRATFHFLISADQVSRYADIAGRCVGGYLIIGTFSPEGPPRCSGLPVSRYDERTLVKSFHRDFEPLTCIREEHVTPFHATQHFIFCSFRKKQENIY